MSSRLVAALSALIVLIGSAAFLALAETSLTRMSRAKALALQGEGRRGADSLARLLDDPPRYLNPVLLLVLVCHLVAATLVGVLAGGAYGGTGIAVAIVVEIAVIFVLAEAIPKTFAIRHPERSALLVAPAVRFVAELWPVRLTTAALLGISRIITPGNGDDEPSPVISEEELRRIADVAVEDEVIEGEERALIHSIIEFGDTVAREVMVPRTAMVSVGGDVTVGDAIEVAIREGYSRIPVFGENIDDIVGVAYAKDLMRAAKEGSSHAPVRELLRAAHFVPETKRVAELLKEMQAQKFHMTVVVDEYGGTAGLVTLEDVIEELVGEIVDEYDVEDPLVEPLPGGDVRVNARMAIDELNDLLHADLPTGDWDTVGGLVYNLLGHVPVEGEAVDCDGHRLRAEKVQGRRIGKVRISRLAPHGELAGGGPGS